MLVIIITCNKDMRTVPNLYIFNLAIIDIIYLTVLFLRALSETISITWLEGKLGCAIFGFCDRMLVGLTAYCVAVISFQRYRVIVNPLHVRASSQPTWRGTGAVIGGMWIVAALLAIPAARSPIVCTSSEMLWLTGFYQRLALFNFLVSCVFPLCVIAFSYIMMARHLLKRVDPLLADTQNPQLNTRTNTARTVLGLILVFLFSYVPYHIWLMYLFYSIKLTNTVTRSEVEVGWFNSILDIMPIPIFFLSLNSCLNPVALFCTGRAFRSHFKRYLTRCCKTKPPSDEFELAKRN
jgi:uncharacterized membrane protein